MANRRIHSIDRMVALHNGSSVLAVFKSSFGELVDHLLSDLSQLERIGFKSAGASFGEFLRKEHVANLPKWEDLFFVRLRERIADVGHLLSFDLTAADEIVTYLPDILEGYRANRIGEFAFFLDQVEGKQASVVTMETYDPPSVWQRIAKSERPAQQRMVVQLEDIRRVIGTSIELRIETKAGSIGLLRNGSINVVREG